MQQCNGSGVEVVTLLSAGRGCDVEELAICQDAALSSIQAKGRKNLDSLAGCGIIGCEHLFDLRNRLVAAGRFRFCIGPLTPMSPHWKTKTGAAMGKSQDSARFDLRYSVVFCVSVASCIGMEGSQSADTCDCVGNFGEQTFESRYLNH